MDKTVRYYGITYKGNGRNQVIYMARSEAERLKILKIFAGTEDRNLMQLVDITRSSKLPNNKIGFQSMEFWMARQNMAVAG